MAKSSNYRTKTSKNATAESGLAFHEGDPFRNYRMQAARLVKAVCGKDKDLYQFLEYVIEIVDDVTGEVLLTDSQVAKFCGISTKAVANRVRKLSDMNFLFAVERGCGTRKTRYALTAEACRFIRKEKATGILRKGLRKGDVDLALSDLGYNPNSTEATTPSRHALLYKEKKKKKEAGAHKAPAKASVDGTIEFEPRVKSENHFVLQSLERLLSEFGFDPGHAIHEKLIPPGEHFFCPVTIPSSSEKIGQLFNVLTSDEFMSLESCFEKATSLTVEN